MEIYVCIYINEREKIEEQEEGNVLRIKGKERKRRKGGENELLEIMMMLEVSGVGGG